MPGGNLGPGVIVETGPAFSAVEVLPGHRPRLRVGVGAVAAEVERVAASVGCTLPFLPSSAPWCTMGGIVANNAAGARSFRHGAVARSVRAVEGVFAWGEPFRLEGGALPPPPFDQLDRTIRSLLPEGLRGWPRVRKNASGYALDRFLGEEGATGLLVGSEGTLAFLTAIELEPSPIPPARALAVLPARDRAELLLLAREADRLGATTCEFLGRRFLELAGLHRDPELAGVAADAEALVLLEASGDPGEVPERIEAFRRLGRSAGGVGLSSSDPDGVKRLWGLRHAASPTIAREAARGFVSTQFIEDCVVPPERLPAFLAALDETLARHRFDAVVFGHAGDANVHVNPLVDVGSGDWRERVRGTLDEVAGVVAELGGTLAGEHGDGRLRAPLLGQVWPEPLVAAFRSVKETLDPRGVLNPGVILPLPGQDPLDGLAPRPRSWPA